MSVSFGSASSFTITDGANPQLIANGDTLTFAAGGDLTVLTSATDTVTYSFTESVTSLVYNGGTGELDYLDEAGATNNISIISTASGNALTYNATGLFVAAADSSSFTLAGNSGIAQTISSGDTMLVSGGTGLTTLASATDTLTVNYDFPSLVALSDGLDAANDRLLIYNASASAHQYINIDDIPGFGAEKVTSLTFNGATGNLDYLDELNVTNNIDIISSTAGNTLTFDGTGLYVPTPSVITNTNITEGALLTATGNRSANFGANSLTFSNMSNFTANVNGGGTARFNTDSLGLFGNGVSPPTFVLGGVTGSVILKSPNTVTNYSITLPNAAPAGNNYVMAFTTAGTASFTQHQYFTAPGSMPAATDNSVVNMNSRLVNFQNCAGFTIGVQTGNVTSLTSPETQLRSPNATAQSLKFYGATGSANWAALKAPNAISSQYTLTLPATGPSASNQVMIFNASGTGSFTTLLNNNLFTADLTLAATRTHQLNLNNFDMRGGTGVNDGSRFQMNGTTLLTKGGDATNSASATFSTGGLNLAFAGSGDLKLNSSAGLSGQYLMTSGPGSAPTWGSPSDTNFSNANLTFAASRAHNLAGNSLTIRGNTSDIDGSVVSVNPTSIALLGAAAIGGQYCILTLNNGGVDFDFQGAGADFSIDGSAGTVGQVLTSSGPGAAPSWEDAPSSIDTSITAGTLAVASGNRTVDMGTNDLLFDNVGLLTVNSEANQPVEFNTDGLIVYGNSASLPGRVLLYDNDNSHFVTLRPNATTTEIYTITLPAASPSANGQVMEFTTAGVATFVDKVDSNITTGSLSPAAGPRIVDMATNDLTFDNLNDVTFNGSALGTFTFDTRNFVIENPSASLGGKLSLADADASRSVSIQSPEVVPTSYTITLPTAAPVSSGQVLIFDTDGTASFGNAGADTNFSTTNLSFSGARTHSFNNNTVTFNGNTNAIDGASIEFAGSVLTAVGGVVGSGNYAWMQADSTGIDLFFAGTTDLQINGNPGTAGQVLLSNGPDAAPSWATVSVVDTNFTTGNLTFTSSRSHSVNSNILSIYGKTSVTDGPYFRIGPNSLSLVGGDGTLLDYTGATFGEASLNLLFVDAHLAINGVAGTSGQVLTSAGLGVPPAWVDPQETLTSLVYNGSTGNLDYTDENGAVNNIDIISATVGNALTFDGTGLYVPAAVSASFTLQGDAGSQTISSGDTMVVSGGTGLSTTVSATDTVTVNYAMNELVALGETVDVANDRLLIYNNSGANHRYVNVDDIAPSLTLTTDGNSTGVTTGGTLLAPTINIKTLGTVTPDNQLSVDTGGGLYFNICDAMGPTTTTITNPTHVWGINGSGTCGWVAVTDC